MKNNACYSENEEYSSDSLMIENILKLHAEKTIDDKQIQRILGPVLQAIKTGQIGRGDCLN